MVKCFINLFCGYKSQLDSKCSLVPTFLLLIKARRCDPKNGNVFSQGPVRLGVFCHIFPHACLHLSLISVKTTEGHM